MAQLATITTDETTDVTKASVFHAWSDSLKLADNWATDVSTAGSDIIASTESSVVLYAYDLSPTSLIFSGIRLRNAAIDWHNISKGFSQSSAVIFWPTTKPIPPRFPIFRPDDLSVINFCARHNVFFDSVRYYTAILDQFDNIEAVRVEMAYDHEIEGYEKLRFRVSLADEIAKIVAEEDCFGDYVQRIFSPEVLSNFAVTLEIPDAR